MPFSPAIPTRAQARADLARARRFPSKGAVLDEDAGRLLVPRHWVTRISDPLRTPPWQVSRIFGEEVRIAEREGRLACTQHPEGGRERLEPMDRPVCRECEIARIAVFYVTDMAQDPGVLVPDDLGAAAAIALDRVPVGATEPHPITVDVGVGAYTPSWMVVDGNHRVAAATVAYGAYLDLLVHGDWDRALRLFVDGVALEDVLDEEAAAWCSA